VQGELIEAPRFEGVHALVGPEVRTVAPVLAELEAVDVRRRSVFECEDQLVARAVERAIPPLSLAQTIRFFTSA
jgi:hypothetical protein